MIVAKGIKVNNLKNIDVNIPTNKLVVITGVSGSGKTSLAFDTLFAEGQRRYVESLSSYARGFLGRMNKPEVEKISGLSPAIAVEQRVMNRNPRSTVGTTTEIYEVTTKTVSGDEVYGYERFAMGMYVNDNDIPEYYLFASYTTFDHEKYNTGDIPIKFCPFCGRELHNTKSLI
jgi:ABC-type dipeptide/oligopeptide/nickel transport system ATPase component